MGWLSDRWRDIKGGVKKVWDGAVDLVKKAVGVVVDVVKSVASLFMPDIETPDGYDAGPVPGTSQRIPASSENKLPVVYGERSVAGAVVMADISSNNKTMAYIIGLSEGPIEGITQMMWTDKLLTFDADITTGLRTVTSVIEPNGDTSSFLNGLLKCRLYADGGRCSEMEAFSTAWGTNGDQRTLPFAYAYIELTYNQEKGVTSLPSTIHFHLKGKKLNTWDLNGVYSNNPSECLYDYLTSTVYGPGLLTSDMDIPSFESYRDFCNEIVDGSPRYTCNGVVNTKGTFDGTTKALTLSTGSALSYSLGLFKVIVLKTEGTHHYINEDDLIGGITISNVGYDVMLNDMIVNYYDEDIRWEKRDFHLDFPKENNEPPLKREITLPFCSNSIEAQRAGRILLKQSRETISTDALVKIDLTYSAGDIIEILSEKAGYDGKQFRIMRIDEVNMNGVHLFKLDLQEYNSDVYADEPITAFDPEPNTNLPNWRNVSSVSNLQYAGSGTGVVVTWDYDGLFKHFRIETPTSSYITTGYSYVVPKGLYIVDVYAVGILGNDSDPETIQINVGNNVILDVNYTKEADYVTISWNILSGYTTQVVWDGIIHQTGTSTTIDVPYNKVVSLIAISPDGIMTEPLIINSGSTDDTGISGVTVYNITSNSYVVWTDSSQTKGRLYTTFNFLRDENAPFKLKYKRVDEDTWHEETVDGNTYTIEFVYGEDYHAVFGFTETPFSWTALPLVLPTPNPITNIEIQTGLYWNNSTPIRFIESYWDSSPLVKELRYKLSTDTEWITNVIHSDQNQWGSEAITGDVVYDVEIRNINMYEKGPWNVTTIDTSVVSNWANPTGSLTPIPSGVVVDWNHEDQTAVDVYEIYVSSNSQLNDASLEFRGNTTKYVHKQTPGDQRWFWIKTIYKDTSFSSSVYIGTTIATALDTIDIGDEVIIGSKLGPGSIQASHIQSNTITANEIVAGTITGTEIAANSIGTDELTADFIAAGMIKASHIDIDGDVRLSDVLGSISLSLSPTNPTNWSAADTTNSPYYFANNLPLNNYQGGTAPSSDIAQSDWSLMEGNADGVLNINEMTTLSALNDTNVQNATWLKYDPSSWTSLWNKDDGYVVIGDVRWKIRQGSDIFQNEYFYGVYGVKLEGPINLPLSMNVGMDPIAYKPYYGAHGDAKFGITSAFTYGYNSPHVYGVDYAYIEFDWSVNDIALKFIVKNPSEQYTTQRLYVVPLGSFLELKEVGGDIGFFIDGIEAHLTDYPLYNNQQTRYTGARQAIFNMKDAYYYNAEYIPINGSNGIPHMTVNGSDVFIPVEYDSGVLSDTDFITVTEPSPSGFFIGNTPTGPEFVVGSGASNLYFKDNYLSLNNVNMMVNYNAETVNITSAINSINKRLNDLE